jgi:hypothetical protein
VFYCFCFDGFDLKFHLSTIPQSPMSLRKFGLSCFSLLAIICSAHAVNAQEKAATAPLYKTIERWIRPPEEMATIGGMHGDIAVSENGDVFVSCGEGPRAGIQVYSSSGKYLRNLPPYHHDFHGFVIARDSEGEFIVGVPSDGQSVVKMRLDGTEVFRVKATDFQGKLKRLTCAVSAPDGRIFAADGYGNDLIHIISAKGEYVKSFGGREEPYQFKTCHKIAVDTRFNPPQLLCCDRENRRLVRLSLEGEVLSSTPNMLRPAAVAIHGDHAFVGEILGRVSILDRNDRIVAHLGHNTEKANIANNQVQPDKWVEGLFTAPHGVALDPAVPDPSDAPKN